MNKSIIYIVIALILVLVSIVVYLFVKPPTSLTLERTTITTQDWKVDISGTAKGIRAVAVEVSTPNGEKKTPIPPIQIADKSGKFRQSVPLFDEATLFTAGEPFVEGDYTITVTSTNPKQKVDQTAKITLEVPLAPTLEISEKTPDKITGKISDPNAKVQADISQEEIPVDANGEFTITFVPPGTKTVTITVINWAGKETMKVVPLNGDNPVITYPPSDHVFRPRVGEPVKFTVTATGGKPSYNYSAEGIPDGATLNPITGQLTWPRAVEGEYSVILTVSDKNGQRDAVSIQISALLKPLRITQPSSKQIPFKGGESVRFTVAATGGTPPYNYSADGLPDGATLNPTTGQFAWPSAVGGDYPVTLTVSDATGQRDEASIQIRIPPSLLLRITQPSPNEEVQFEVGQPIRFTITATGGSPPYSYSAEGLPAGAILNPTTGQFTWPRAVGGDYRVTLTVRDNTTGQHADVTIRLVGGPMVIILDPLPPSITKNTSVPIAGRVQYPGLRNLEGTVTIRQRSESLTLQPSDTPTDANFQYTANLNEGVNSISLSVRDTNNPQNHVERTITIVRDTKPPSFSYNGNPTTQIIRSKEDTTAISVTVVDETSPLSSITTSWGERPQPSGKEYPMRIQASALRTDDNQLTAIDAAGNTATLMIIVPPPIKMEVIAPTSGMITNQNSVVVSGTVVGGYGAIKIKVNDQLLTPDPQGNFSGPVRLNEGANPLRVIAQDSLETPQTERKEITVTWDARKPVFIYNGSPVTSIERLIVEGNFTVDITDESGIASVMLNAKGISSRDGKTWAIPVNDLKRGDNELIATDKATNTAPLKIIAKSDPREKEAWERAQAAFDERRYADARNVLNYLEKEFGINASVRLFRGMITYEALEGQDVLERYNKLKGAIQDFDLAYADRETYLRGSDNIHHNRYYWGMTYYKLMVLAKQSYKEKLIIETHRSQAVEMLTSFITNVGNRVPTLKQEAERIIRELR